MRRYKYMADHIGGAREMNEFGEQGYRVVFVAPQQDDDGDRYMIFEKEVDDDAAPVVS